MPADLRRCPDCEAELGSASALVDHALARHVEAPAARLRKPRWPRLTPVAVVIGVLLALGVWAGLVLDATGAFEKSGAAETPGSYIHAMAVELRNSGVADDYRAVEPARGWDTEYELTDGGVLGGDALIRIKHEGTPEEDVEFESTSDELYDAVLNALEKRGYTFEEE